MGDVAERWDVNSSDGRSIAVWSQRVTIAPNDRQRGSHRTGLGPASSELFAGIAGPTVLITGSEIGCARRGHVPDRRSDPGRACPHT
jgi:hypothetical protein